jgi:preprotein translocase subunit SecA
MDALREGVGLRAQGQKDPLIEYKNEAYELFVTLMDSIKREALQNLFRSAANLEAFLKQLHSQPKALQGGEESLTQSNIAITGNSSRVPGTDSDEAPTLKLNLPKRKPSFSIETTGRNAPCPCGSGKKFKQCCGKEIQ